MMSLLPKGKAHKRNRMGISLVSDCDVRDNSCAPHTACPVAFNFDINPILLSKKMGAGTMFGQRRKVARQSGPAVTPEAARDGKAKRGRWPGPAGVCVHACSGRSGGRRCTVRLSVVILAIWPLETLIPWEEEARPTPNLPRPPTPR